MQQPARVYSGMPALTMPATCFHATDLGPSRHSLQQAAHRLLLQGHTSRRTLLLLEDRQPMAWALSRGSALPNRLIKFYGEIEVLRCMIPTSVVIVSNNILRGLERHRSSLPILRRAATTASSTLMSSSTILTSIPPELCRDIPHHRLTMGISRHRLHQRNKRRCRHSNRRCRPARHHLCPTSATSTDPSRSKPQTATDRAAASRSTCSTGRLAPLHIVMSRMLLSKNPPPTVLVAPLNLLGATRPPAPRRLPAAPTTTNSGGSTLMSLLGLSASLQLLHRGPQIEKRPADLMMKTSLHLAHNCLSSPYSNTICGCTLIATAAPHHHRLVLAPVNTASDWLLSLRAAAAANLASLLNALAVVALSIGRTQFYVTGSHRPTLLRA